MAKETSFGLLNSPAISVVRNADIPYKAENIGATPIDVKTINWETSTNISDAVDVYTSPAIKDTLIDSAIFNVLIVATTSTFDKSLVMDYMSTYEDAALQKGVENGFWKYLEEQNATSAGVKAKTKVAFAQLENKYSEITSGGQGVIHAPRGYADIYKGTIEGKNLLNHVGTPIIAGGGYKPTSGKIYETGPVEVLLSDSSEYIETDIKNNTVTLTKEYTVVISYMDGPVSTEIDLTLE